MITCMLNAAKFFSEPAFRFFCAALSGFFLSAVSLSATLAAPLPAVGGVGAAHTVRAQNVYGHYTDVPPALSAEFGAVSCRGAEPCETLYVAGGATVGARYNAYAYSKRHNPRGRLSMSCRTDAADEIVGCLTLSYRLDGQIAEKRVWGVDAAGDTERETTDYRYDAQQHMVGERRTLFDHAAPVSASETTLAYDASNNRLLSSVNGHPDRAFSYNGLDRDTCDQSTRHGRCRLVFYDKRGNLSSGEDGEHFVYNDRSLLLSRRVGGMIKSYRDRPDETLAYTEMSGEAPVFFYTDAEGKLSGREQRQAHGHLWQSHNFWFGGDLAARAVTGTDKRIVQGVHFSFDDYMRSPLLQSDADGHSSGLLRYDPAGVPLKAPSERSAPLLHWPLGYAGGVVDTLFEHGKAHALAVFGVREKDGDRFLQRDTNLEPLNGYVYADGDLPNKVDDSGRAAVPVFADNDPDDGGDPEDGEAGSKGVPLSRGQKIGLIGSMMPSIVPSTYPLRSEIVDKYGKAKRKEPLVSDNLVKLRRSRRIGIVASAMIETAAMIPNMVVGESPDTAGIALLGSAFATGLITQYALSKMPDMLVGSAMPADFSSVTGSNFQNFMPKMQAALWGGAVLLTFVPGIVDYVVTSAREGEWGGQNLSNFLILSGVNLAVNNLLAMWASYWEGWHKVWHEKLMPRITDKKDRFRSYLRLICRRHTPASEYGVPLVSRVRSTR